MEPQKEKIKNCPKCGSDNIIKIVYGKPGPKLIEQSEQGKVKLGGCCISSNSPHWFCKQCNKKF